MVAVDPSHSDVVGSMVGRVGTALLKIPDVQRPDGCPDSPLQDCNPPRQPGCQAATDRREQGQGNPSQGTSGRQPGKAPRLSLPDGREWLEFWAHVHQNTSMFMRSLHTRRRRGPHYCHFSYTSLQFGINPPRNLALSVFCSIRPSLDFLRFKRIIATALLR